MKTVTVATDHARVRLTALSNQADDIGALLYSVVWDTTGSGRFVTEAFFYEDDLERFHSDLKQLSNVAEGQTEILSVEEEVHLSVRYENRRILVQGIMTIPTLARLEFNFETEPGHLGRS